jgi:hypothetical protein
MSSASQDPFTSSHPSQQTVLRTEEKRQPWKAIWPAPRESQPQAQIFGFKKGEVMVFDGNAGNFFARDGWTVEQESSKE